MTAMLDTPLTATEPIPSDLVAWALTLGIGERRLALAASDCPTGHAEQEALLGHPRRCFPLPADLHAAAVTAQHIAQGVERLGGEMAVWQLSEKQLRISRTALRTGDWDGVRAFERAHGGAKRLDNGMASSLNEWAGAPQVCRERRMVTLFHAADDDGVAIWHGRPMPLRDARMLAVSLGAELQPFHEGFVLA